MIINLSKRQVVDTQWAIEGQMVNGTAVFPEPMVTANSRIKPFGQDSGVSGALHSELSPGVGFTIVSSNQADSGLIYCEVIF